MFQQLAALALSAATPALPAPPLPPTSATTSFHKVQVGGVGIFYREAGPRDAPTLVLLHGFPSSSREFDSLIPLLATRYHLVAPDYPGFAQSDAPSPDTYRYSFDHLAQTTSALLDQLGIRHYSLYLHDHGAPVGYRMILAHPERLQARIVQNGNAYREGLGPKWAKIAAYWTAPAAHPEVVDAFLSFDVTKQRHLAGTRHPERYNSDSWTDEAAHLAQHGQRAIQAALLYDYPTNVAAYPLWQAWLRTHRPPTLVAWGANDPSVVAAAGAEAYRRDLPDAEIHLLDAGHFALDEATDPIAQLILDFLARHPG
jgi:pimeloyl-ACP methyl ester carboxylesterase